MIEAIIFDMDGLIIDSTPLWMEAEVNVFNRHEVPVTLEMAPQTTGLRTDEVVKYWAKRFPGKIVDIDAVASEIDLEVTKLIVDKGEPMPGVIETFDACASLGLPMAIASSSPIALIETVAEKIGIKEKLTALHSAHDEEYGKPHPAVYIRTAETLGVPADHCLAFEDSPNGVIAAKSAKMRCIAVPEPELRDDKRFGIADIIIHSLKDFNPQMLSGW